MLGNAFEIVFLVGLIVGSVVRAVYTIPCRRNQPREDRRTGLDTLLVAFASVGLLLPVCYLLTPWLDFADYRLPAWAGWAGGGVFAAAVWLLWRSHVALARNWAPVLQIREGHSLVAHGVYRHVRHPMYAAHWLWGVAQALLLHNWLAGPALLVCFLPLYLHRVPREERMLLEHFGEEYRRYASRTGRLLPRRWR